MASRNNTQGGEGQLLDDPRVDDLGTEEGAAPAGRRVDPGFRRNMMIIGGVLAACLVLVLFAVFRFQSNSKAQQSTAGVGVSAGMGVQADESARLSPQMQEAMREAERQRVEREAQSGGRVSVPVAMPGDVEKVDPRGTKSPEQMYQDLQTQASAPATGTQGRPAQGAADQRPVDPYVAQQQAAQQAAEQQAAQQAWEEAHRARVELAKQQLGTGGGFDVTVPQRVSFTRPEGSTPAGGAQQSAGASMAAAPSGPLLTDAMEIYAAELMSPIDSYKGAYVSARVISGKLQGAFIRGQITPSEDGVTMEFSQMRHAGQTCRISAVGMDEKTAHTLVDTNVDRRYMQRYFWPVVVAAIGGAAQAKASTGQQVIPVANGGVAISTPPATRQQVIAAGTQSAAQIVQREVDRAASKPPQFTLPVGSVIGLMFNEAVAANCAASR